MVNLFNICLFLILLMHSLVPAVNRWTWDGDGNEIKGSQKVHLQLFGRHSARMLLDWHRVSNNRAPEEVHSGMSVTRSLKPLVEDVLWQPFELLRLQLISGKDTRTIWVDDGYRLHFKNWRCGIFPTLFSRSKLMVETPRETSSEASWKSLSDLMLLTHQKCLAELVGKTTTVTLCLM